MHYPKISINVVTFNRPELLARCIASIDKQDYPNKEVIIVDDAKEGLNMSGCRNKAINISTSDYVYIIDDDDYLYDASTLKQMYEFLDRGYDVVCSDYYIADYDEEEKVEILTRAIIKHGDLMKEQCYPHGGTLWRKDKIPRYNEQEPLGADLDLWLTAQENGLKIGIYPFPTWVYQRGHSRMSDLKLETNESCKRILASRQR